MKYWQHGETGLCCAVKDDIDLSRRHYEITEDQYKKYLKKEGKAYHDSMIRREEAQV